MTNITVKQQRRSVPVRQPIAGLKLCLAVSISKLSDTLKQDVLAGGGVTHHPIGCKPDASEPILCYKASRNNSTRQDKTPRFLRVNYAVPGTAIDWLFAPSPRVDLLMLNNILYS